MLNVSCVLSELPVSLSEALEEALESYPDRL